MMAVILQEAKQSWNAGNTTEPREKRQRSRSTGSLDSVNGDGDGRGDEARGDGRRATVKVKVKVKLAMQVEVEVETRMKKFPVKEGARPLRVWGITGREREREREEMSVSGEVVERIRSYDASCREVEKERSVPLTAANYEEHSRQIEKTLRGLREQVQRQEDALRELRASAGPLELPRPDLQPHERLAQTRRAIQAYKSLLSDSKPQLPAPDSPLNGLLALREANRLVRELKSTIPLTAQELVRDRERLKVEEANLRDANGITAELQRRIKELRQQRRDNDESGAKHGGKKSKQESNRIAKELIREQRRKGREIEEKTVELKEALREFVDEHLAPMLAAEDMGGPVVGDQIEVSDSTLEIGYTARGKERKASKAGNGQSTGSKKQQQRIDELLRRGRRRSGAQGRDGGHEEENDEDGDETRITNPREAAAEEMHSLIESLLNIAATSSYIELDQDSAASRFLVKAKIAQFHPRDSRKLRLIDVAREIAD
ncbi:uncharacterized protein GIQ15_05738 [Arthroderma uncinatum]|uniref:uncharacterized protein n=1 Tax=Arthroderma uncinatum TaxID=74035 RepID=UPI00144AE963|nr:uncharacterized protein GIQ15_05738 [Arthroderma uncinatum]KAF3480391.1 hypothetical protein GIQ15_05738 [Arthroderma uncinatum]